jgi:ATP-binding protein involved in chromosome partitioning
VKDPQSQQDIGALGLVRDLAIEGDRVAFSLAFTSQPPQTRVTVHTMATRLVGQIPGVRDVQVRMGAGAAAAAQGAGAQGGHAHGHDHAHGHGHGDMTTAPAAAARPQPSSDLIPGVRHTIAVSSGKGGVGKSTVAVNLAAALRATGATVGIIDADVYGPDVPMMLGARGKPGMFDNRIIPVEAHGIKMMSIGLLVQEREALVWRGPMIHSFIQQMLKDVSWGALDYLVFDMPPGTGDAQLSLSQVLPLSGVVMVTTPQDVALLDVRKALGMFQRLNVPILGVVENMSEFACPHCGQHTAIFGNAGGQRISDEYGVPLLARIPLEPETRKAGDEGHPISLGRPDSPQARAFADLARAVERRLEELGPLSTLPTVR